MARGIRTATRGVRQGTGAPRERARAGIGLHASENVPCSATTRRGRASRWCCSTRCSRCSRCASSRALWGRRGTRGARPRPRTAAQGPRRRSTVRPHVVQHLVRVEDSAGATARCKPRTVAWKRGPKSSNHADDLSHTFRRSGAHGHASEIERGRAVVALWRLLCPRTRRLGQ